MTRKSLLQASPPYETLEISARDPGFLVVALNRPDRHNAFNETVVRELREVFDLAGGDPEIRGVLLQGHGPSFSAGADISWMKANGEGNREANLVSARRMADMFEAVHSCPKPVVARVHGAALGGGAGLLSAADIAIATEDAKIGFTEVRLGILPAVISPYVVEKIGTARARALFLLGRRFDGREARRLGLVFDAVPEAELDASIDRALADLTKGGPHALREAKRLALSFLGESYAARREDTAARIADIRLSEEAQEGLAAFLEKRPPNWVRKTEGGR